MTQWKHENTETKNLSKKNRDIVAITRKLLNVLSGDDKVTLLSSVLSNEEQLNLKAIRQMIIDIKQFVGDDNKFANSKAL